MDDSSAQTLEQYRRGLEAEQVLLHRLQDVARRQRDGSLAADIDALNRAADERDRLMAGMVAIEHQLGPVRDALRRARPTLQRLRAFRDVAALHTTVGRMIEETLETDQDSIRALEEVVAARRLASHAVEQGESTLAAYGRMATPPPAATLVNRRG